MRRYRLTCMLIGLTATSITNADELFVAFWNVENLFDTVDDLRIEDDEDFTPSAPKQWTRERYEKKCQNLAKVIRDMNGGRGPDVLGLGEVETTNALYGVLSAIAPLNRSYELVHTDSPSNRGIDCALLVDRDSARVKSIDFHAVQGVETRDILEAQLGIGEKRLYVFVNHWPSHVSDPNGSQRGKAADVLRNRIDKILQENAMTDIVIGGDLNDHTADESVRVHLKALTDESMLQTGDLFSTMGAIAATPGAGTYFYDGEWEIIDHVIISQGLLDSNGFRWRRDSTIVIKNEYQLFTPAGGGPARPNRTYSDDQYFGGYSDHLPVACTIEF